MSEGKPKKASWRLQFPRGTCLEAIDQGHCQGGKAFQSRKHLPRGREQAAQDPSEERFRPGCLGAACVR